MSNWRYLPTHWAGGNPSERINLVKIEADDVFGAVAYIEHHGGDGTPTDEDYDRAALIAAAPKLRDALQEILAMAEARKSCIRMPNGMMLDTFCRSVRAATKREGKR